MWYRKHLWLSTPVFTPSVEMVIFWPVFFPDQKCMRWGDGLPCCPWREPACGSWCFQCMHYSSQVFLSQDSVESCENTCNRLAPSGLRSPPALQANCYCLCLSFYSRRCHISSWSWGEIEDWERTVMDGLVPDSEKDELWYLHTWSFTLSDKRRPGLCCWLPSETSCRYLL